MHRRGDPPPAPVWPTNAFGVAHVVDATGALVPAYVVAGGPGAPAYLMPAADLAASLDSLRLNPDAREFVPPMMLPTAQHAAAVNAAVAAAAAAAAGMGVPPHHHHGHAPLRRAPTARAERDARARAAARKKSAVQRALEEAGAVRRTVYICDIDQSVTEAELAAAFAPCGAIVDCRVCGDPNSAMRFAFIEFRDPASVPAALAKTGTVLGAYPLRVAPSKTAIVPVNRAYLPSSADERAQCARTVYAANIDRRVTAADVRAFFEGLCGPVARLRLLGDGAGGGGGARIAFVEFESAASAAAALNCSGALLGSLPIRVSPSKTPVRDDAAAPAGGGGGGRRKGRRGGGGGGGGGQAAAAAAPEPPAPDANGEDAASPVENGAKAETEDGGDEEAEGDGATDGAADDADDAPAPAAEASTPAPANGDAKPPASAAAPAPPADGDAAATPRAGLESSGSAATPAAPATPSGGT